MTSVRFAMLLVMLFTSTVCFAQDKHPIDKYLECEIAKDSTTAGMVNASVKAREKWDAEMNKYYKFLMSILDEKSKEILRDPNGQIRFKEKNKDIYKSSWPLELVYNLIPKFLKVSATKSFEIP